MVTARFRLPDSSDPAEALLSIAAVEHETGLGKDTLRAWERRYGFPAPVRDAAGVRGYPRAMVERLRLIRRALIAGQRPGRLLALPPRELDALLAQVAFAPQAAQAPAAAPGALLDVADCIAALRVGGAEGLRHWLTRGLARLGLGQFVADGLAPLTAAIGHAWLDGRLAVYEEHLYCEAVQSVVRSGMLPFQAGIEASAPRVLLTTVPGEGHGLALLMAEALLTLEACSCLPLGVQTPIGDIVAAARAHRIDVVVLSFSESLDAGDALAALLDLRARLPAAVAIWAGGGNAALRSPRLGRIQVLARLLDLPQAVGRWRKDAGPAPELP
jgi:hypothetical protein